METALPKDKADTSGWRTKEHLVLGCDDTNLSVHPRALCVLWKRSSLGYCKFCGFGSPGWQAKAFVRAELKEIMRVLGWREVC